MNVQKKNILTGGSFVLLSVMIGLLAGPGQAIAAALLAGGAFFIGIAFGYDFKEVEITGKEGAFFHPIKPREKTSGVSPVIGVILMVAITVILASVIAAFVFGMVSNISSPFAPDNAVKVIEILPMGGYQITSSGEAIPILQIKARFVRNGSPVLYRETDIPLPLTHPIDAGSCYLIPSWDWTACRDEAI